MAGLRIRPRAIRMSGIITRAGRLGATRIRSCGLKLPGHSISRRASAVTHQSQKAQVITSHGDRRA